MAPRERTWNWEWWFDAPPARVWPVASDTDRMDRLAGLPVATYAEAEDGADGALTARQTFFGVLPVAYDERPFEWVEGEHFEVLRTFSKGPVAYMRVRTELRPDGRGTRVSTRIDARARSLLHAAFVPIAMRRAKRGLDRAYARLEREVVEGGADRPARRSVLRKALSRFERTSAEAPRDLATMLSTHVASSDAADLRRIRPFALADRWGMSRRDVLAAALWGVRAGVLELAWESLCPHCRGPKASARTLADVRSRSRCDACAVDFEVEFDRSLEAVFRPSPDLRRVGSDTWCLAGPGRTPHVVAQARVAPGAEQEVTVRLAPGAYRVRALRRPASAPVHAGEGEGEPEVSVALSEGGASVSTSTARAGAVRWRLRNEGGREAVAVLERAAWLDDVATAMDVVAVPGFRDLFASEVLARDERIAVGRVAVLFTDLRGSTALYRAIGDPAAYALVREHFQAIQKTVAHHGGIFVKTIGDAVMAAFRSAPDALRAAVDMLDAVARLPAPRGAPGLVLKAGVHCGPSIVVNAGGRLDYFGTTTNLAARAQHESLGGDVVVTDAVLADEESAACLASLPHRRESFRAPLKGFEGDVLLHRLTPLPPGEAPDPPPSPAP
jgi:class 3 adenylate cyclase